MSKKIFVVTTETYCDGDYNLEIDGAFITKEDATKKMEACADGFMEEANEFGESDYERDDQVDAIILTSNNASCEVYMSIQETTLNE
mgnify:CR=1 FL=1